MGTILKVFRKRLLHYINLFIGLVLVALLALAWRYAWRVLPRTSGTMAAPLSRPATVARDALGVPHITAANQEDAWFVQGFVTAQDRLFQMEFMRRQAGGELAEIFGRPAVESDRESRLLRLRRIAEAQARTLTPPDRQALAAYARGVNFFLETHRDRLPVEFTLLRFDPRPWSIVDSILIGLQMVRTLTTSWRDEILKHNLLLAGDAAKVQTLFPVRTGQEVQPGSNAWVLGGSRTRSGRPLLANDPHLQYSLPSAWYQVHLKAEGLDVSGVSLPGLPSVIIGHNRRIAWGLTNLQFDVQDLYRERLDPQSGRYLFRGQPQQAAREREPIAVKGEPSRELAGWVTRHGPVMHSEGGQAFALRWVAADPGSFAFSFPEINRAGNWKEFRHALARFLGPAQNFVYADVEGNIGYQAAGRLPIRKKHAGDVPVDGGGLGELEWEGFIPFDELPSVYNPPSGMIVTANQNPFPAAYRYAVHGNFASHYRSRQIEARLESRKSWDVAGMLSVQKDVYSAFSHFLAQQAVAAWEASAKKPALVRPAIEQLRRWNGQMEPGLAAAMLATLHFQHLRKAVAERAAPGKGAGYELQMAAAVIEDLLRRRPREWFSDYDELLLASLADALEEGTRMQGKDPAKWEYGRFHVLGLAHPILGGLPLVGKYFRIGPLPMSGSSTTVHQTTPRLGPSMRMVVDVGRWDNSVQNLTIGQSGHVLSRHYRDQWDAYYAGRSFPMQFERVDARAKLELAPVTEPRP